MKQIQLRPGNGMVVCYLLQYCIYISDMDDMVQKMTGLITMFKVIFGFIAICFGCGVILWLMLDEKPWRKNSKFRAWLKKKENK